MEVSRGTGKDPKLDEISPFAPILPAGPGGGSGAGARPGLFGGPEAGTIPGAPIKKF